MEYNTYKRNRIYEENDIEQFQQQQRLKKLSLLFNKLYHSLNPNCPENYTLPKNFQNLLQRILSTNFNVIKKDESIIVNSLLEKVYKLSNYNKETMNRFQYLYSILTKKKNISKRWCILYLLNSLSKNNYKNLNFSATNKLQQNYLQQPNNLLMNSNCIDFLLNNSNGNLPDNFIDINNNKYNNNYSNISNNLRNDYINNDCNINCSKKCMNFLNNLSPISDVNEKFCENENLIICNDKLNYDKKNNKKEPLTIVVEPKKTSLKITEKDIINDLLFVFEGINGKYIAYDASKDAFILSKLIPWSEEIYNIVNSLSELGWLYKKIKNYIDYFKNSKTKSQFVQSFIYAIQKELDEYFKLISFFKKMNNNRKTGNEIGKKDLNLKNLLLWTLDQKEKLKWIAESCESIYSLKGPPVLSQIYSFVKFGGCKDYLNNVLNEVSKPFISFIVDWIKYGKLEDPYKEFFVEILNGIGEDDIWNLKYQIIGKNVPNFMKREPTIKIFEVGKCIHFIKSYCKENYNLSNLKNILSELITKDINNNYNNNLNVKYKMIGDGKIINKKNNLENMKFNYGFDDDKIKYEIESLQSCYDFINYIFSPLNQEEILNISFLDRIIDNIDIIHKLINKDLIRIIFDKFKFLTNLESINKYLLLGQGDMMQTLMESLFEELDKPANLIFKHILQSNLESAIRASNAEFKDEENIKKLNIKLINPSPGDVGWDIFCLDYKVDLPLNIIFSSKLLKDYQKLFLFFWKIKRIEFSQINYIWKKIKNLCCNYSSMSTKNKNFIKKTMRISVHFNQEIIHFITNLHNYFALEVLESQYKKLKSELLKVNNLGELIIKHRQFVDNIKKQCLLDEESVTINKKIISIFDIILRFREAFDILSSLIAELNYENENSKYGNSSYINHNRYKNTKEYLKQIILLYKEFHNQMVELIKIIDIVGKNNLKYLSMKLDFNYYYSFMEKEEEDKQNLLALKKIEDDKERKRILYDEMEKEIYTNNNNDNEEEDDDDNYNIRNYNNINADDEPDINNDDLINNNYTYNNLSRNDNNINNSNINNINDEDNIEDKKNFDDDNINFKRIYKNNINNNLYNEEDNIGNYDRGIDNDDEEEKIDNKGLNNLRINNYFNKSNNNKNYKDYNFNYENNSNNIINKKTKPEKTYNLESDLNKYNPKKKNISEKDDTNDLNYINKRRENILDKNYDYNNISNSINLNASSNNDINSYSNINLNNNDSFNNNYLLQGNKDQKNNEHDINNISGQGLTYSYNNKEEMDTNLDNIDDDDQITTQIKPKIYGVSKRTNAKRDNKNK